MVALGAGEGVGEASGGVVQVLATSCELPTLAVPRTSRTRSTRSMNSFGVGLCGVSSEMKAARSALKQSLSALKLSVWVWVAVLVTVFPVLS
ncbi:hypothetical protein GCM10009574_088320 [Streptomyces asiaticus]|uniref:Uncharacterized protein n=1 Tax=Streptomyces rhizosphaericus TaxID=114699 RepID=A0ABP4D4F1_9ACTN